MRATENGQYLDTRVFKQLWEWFLGNQRVVELSSPSA